MRHEGKVIKSGQVIRHRRDKAYDCDCEMLFIVLSENVLLRRQNSFLERKLSYCEELLRKKNSSRISYGRMKSKKSMGKSKKRLLFLQRYDYHTRIDVLNAVILGYLKKDKADVLLKIIDQRRRGLINYGKRGFKESINRSVKEYKD